MMKNKFENFANNNKMSTEEEDAIIDAGVKRAQEIARTNGLRIGQIVAHPNDRIAYELKEVNGNVAQVWVPDKEDTIKEFPLDELFDPNEARRHAVRTTVEIKNTNGSETIH